MNDEYFNFLGKSKFLFYTLYHVVIKKYNPITNRKYRILHKTKVNTQEISALFLSIYTDNYLFISAA